VIDNVGATSAGGSGSRVCQDAGMDTVKLFISYSHDSDAHKEWVKSLAKRLEADGIDVIFDQQDLRIAMSTSMFMEDSLRSCDRVLLVITEPYVTKSNNLTGGVAYERMIITSEIARNLRTTRFIPLLRSGENVPAFLGDRLRVDAREGTDWETNYQALLAELRRPIDGARAEPEVQESAKVVDIKAGTRTAEKTRQPRAVDSYHWSHHVHSHVGNKLYLVFVKFVSTGVKFADSIVNSIEDAGISDYHIYELYASHDVLIRAWANQDSFYRLRENIFSNKDVEARHTELMEASGIHHFPDEESTSSPEEITKLIETLDAETIETVQTDTAEVAVIDSLIANGLRISDSVRFNKERIQFYIIVRAIRHDVRMINRFEERANDFFTIYNKTIYRTTGTASEAVIKGQVSQDHYYHINDFVNAVTETLDHGDIRTETALVAHEGPRGSGLIDTREAERYLLERKYRTLIGQGRRLSPTEDMMLLARFAEAAPAMAEDRVHILSEMIRLRAQGDSENFNHIRSFFAEFEGLLRKHMDGVIASIFGARFEEGKSGLFAAEKIAITNTRRIVLGDLIKIYRRLIEEHGIISLNPLTEDEFRSLMADSVEIRNKLAHGVPELKFWENTFQFFQGFVRIDFRLYQYLMQIK
jgi:hypothetical protein